MLDIVFFNDYIAYVSWIFTIVKFTFFNLDITKGQDFCIHLLCYALKRQNILDLFFYVLY